LMKLEGAAPVLFCLATPTNDDLTPGRRATLLPNTLEFFSHNLSRSGGQRDELRVDALPIACAMRRCHVRGGSCASGPELSAPGADSIRLRANQIGRAALSLEGPFHGSQKTRPLTSSSQGIAVANDGLTNKPQRETCLQGSQIRKTVTTVPP